MAKHTTISSHTLSRRSLLAGASTIAAVASITPAAAQQGTGRQPDAELLELQARFDPLYAAWCKQMAADHLERFNLEIALEKATGVKLADVENDPTGEWTPEKKAYWKTRKNALKTIPRDPPREDADLKTREFEALRDALDELAADIMAFNADTREGLGLQARAMIVASFENIEPSFEWDGEAPDDWLRCLLRSLCSFANTEFPAYRSFTELLLDREG